MQYPAKASGAGVDILFAGCGGGRAVNHQFLTIGGNNPSVTHFEIHFSMAVGEDTAGCGAAPIECDVSTKTIQRIEIIDHLLNYRIGMERSCY